MQESSLFNFIVGVVLILVGLAIIVFHRSIKERRDWWNSRDFPAGLGDAWTGKYTRGGLIFTYAVIVLFGLLLVGVGVSLIVRASRPTPVSDQLQDPIGANMVLIGDAVLDKGWEPAAFEQRERFRNYRYKAMD